MSRHVYSLVNTVHPRRLGEDMASDSKDPHTERSCDMQTCAYRRHISSTCVCVLCAITTIVFVLGWGVAAERLLCMGVDHRFTSAYQLIKQVKVQRLPGTATFAIVG